MVSSLVAIAEAEGEAADLSMLNRRLQAIAMVHERLNPIAVRGQIALREFLVPLVHGIVGSIAPTSTVVTIEDSVTDAPLPLRRATNLGLIVNELVTNSIKHGFRGRPRGSIGLEADIHDDRLDLTYTDDGVGVGGAPPSGDGIGSHLVEELVHQLSGSITTSPAQPSGTRIEIRIPCVIQPTRPAEND
jgi:two-component sensor histidine kinase